MQFLQPNENASRDLWIGFFEGNCQKQIWGGKEMKWGRSERRGCGVIKRETKWMKSGGED